MQYLVGAAYLAQRGRVFFDLETTGFDPRTDRIYQLAAIRVSPNGQREELDLLVNPGRALDREWCSRVGITDPAWPQREGLPQAVALGRFLEFARADVLVGHNIHTFDNLFLDHSLAREGLSSLAQHTSRPAAFIDTLLLAEKLLGRWYENGQRDWSRGGPRNFKLATLAQYLRLTGETDDLHSALGDSRLVEQLFDYLVRERLSAALEAGREQQQRVWGRPAR